MAKLKLRERETQGKYLPEICMVCGEPSETHIRKTFSWFPPWIIVTILLGWLPYLVLVMVLTKRMSVDVPVCGRHTGHFWKRTLLTWAAVVTCFLITAIVCGIGAAMAPPGGDPTPAVMPGIVTFILLLIATVIVIVVAQSSAIKPKEITDNTITLVKVHDHFVDAFEEQYERRRSRYYDDDEEDDYDRPSQRRSPSVREDTDLPPGRRDRFRDRYDDDPPRQRRRLDDDE